MTSRDRPELEEIALWLAAALEDTDPSSWVDAEDLNRAAIDGRFDLIAVADRWLKEMDARDSP